MARGVDRGFDVDVFVEMLKHLTRYADLDLSLGVVDVAGLHAFFEQWIAELGRGEH